MPTRRVSATEFSRNLSSCLNEVRYQDMTLEVWRGREMVARVVPPDRLIAAPPEHQNRLQAALSKMGDEQADALLDDLKAVRQVLSVPMVPPGARLAHLTSESLAQPSVAALVDAPNELSNIAHPDAV